jgi:heat shock protein HslJ
MGWDTNQINFIDNEMKRYYLILVSFLLLASCKKQEDAAAVADGLFLNTSGYNITGQNTIRATDNSSVNILGKWNFLYYSDKKKHSYETTLEFKDERASGGTLNLSGRLVMNFYTATFKLDNDKITIENIGTTKVGVTGEGATFEQKFIASLRNAIRLEALDKNTLLVHLSEPKNEVMYFGR